MVAKVVLSIYAVAVMFQSISAQCCGRAPSPCCGASWGGASSFAPASGASFPISSASSYAPDGVAVLSDNEYSGDLNVRGALPFLGTVGLQGCLPTSGCSKVCYGCGDGQVAMLSEGIGAASCGCGRAAYY